MQTPDRIAFPVDSVFPPHPWRLNKSHRTRQLAQLVVVLLLTLTGGVLFTGYSLSLLKEKWDERELWSSGLAATEVRYEGRVEGQSKFGITIFYTYDLEVEYRTNDGEEQKGKLEFTTLFSKAEGESASLRYDPSNPARFALSLSAESGLAGWGPPLAFLTLGFIFLGFTRTAWRTGRHLRDAAVVAAEDGQVLLVQVDECIANGNGTVTVKYQLPEMSPGGKSRFEQHVPKPLIIRQSAADHVLVVRSPRMTDKPFVLLQGLLPFDFTESEAKRMVDEVTLQLQLSSERAA